MDNHVIFSEFYFSCPMTSHSLFSWTETAMRYAVIMTALWPYCIHVYTLCIVFYLPSQRESLQLSWRLMELPCKVL